MGIISSKKDDMKYVWVLKVYIRKEWIIHNIYSSRAKALIMASTFSVATSITKWEVK